jgi:4-hydroxybenzoate polyprenyltransferase
MAVRSLYRLFLIGGLIVLAGILGGFIGAYLLFKAIDVYGSWFYLGLGVAFVVIVVVFYIYDSRKEKSKATTQFETPKQSDHSEIETHEDDDSSS